MSPLILLPIASLLGILVFYLTGSQFFAVATSVLVYLLGRYTK